MTDPKEDAKPKISTRVPKKKTQGIFDNLRKLPEPHPVEEILGLAPPGRGSTPSTGPTPSTGSTPSTPSTQASGSSIAPERDYTKVANSIVRQAIPSGLFGEQGGKSKELYDALYLLTRGAVVPRRKVRIPKDQLMEKAGIGSGVTLRKNLTRLRSVGLIKEQLVPGTHGGNEYEVFLPEEVGLSIPTPSTPSRGGSSQDVSTTSGEDKTFIKDMRTIDDDDAALAGLTSTLKQAAKDVTGKETSLTEQDRWRELGEVIATELRIAAARTTVSSAPSFLAEHLRRRLFKKDKGQLQAEATAPTQVATTSGLFDPERIKKCPDCGGTGFRYKGENFTGGVEKCRHEKLTASPEST